jgi:hypothetical protein
MKRIGFAGLCLAAAVAMPAQAHTTKSDSDGSGSHKCQPHAVAFIAKGTLESASLTQTQGASTESRRDDRWSGDVTVDVKKASHHAATGSQTYTLSDARVQWYDANHDHAADTPKAGDRVRVKGHFTRLARKCDQTGFTSTTTVRRVEFKPAKTKHQGTSGDSQAS